MKNSVEELLETLEPQQSMQLRIQEYEAKSKTLDSLLRLKVVQAETKERGISADIERCFPADQTLSGGEVTE